MKNEFRIKQKRIQALLEEHKLDGLLLQQVSSFAWATCGASSYVDIAVNHGRSQLLVTKSGRFLISDNIEAPRLTQEEKLAEQGWEVLTPRWHDSEQALARLTKGLAIGADSPCPGSVDLSSIITRMRANLTVPEVKRFKMLGKLCAQAMEATVRSIRPGQSEYRIAAKLSYETGKRGIQAIVNLVATDERIFSYRHPLPTDRKLERYAMVVLCGRRWGLVCSLTRLIHFGSLPDGLKVKADAVAYVDASFIAGTQQGERLGNIFKHGIAAYAEAGYADEWQLQHQGGLAGYKPHEIIATNGSDEIVSVRQAYAWNPSITGTKSEDTILVTEQGYQILTAIKDWPTIPIQINGQIFLRPAILERN